MLLTKASSCFQNTCCFSSCFRTNCCFNSILKYGHTTFVRKNVYQVVVLTKNTLFLLALKDWQVAVLTTNVVSLKFLLVLKGLTSSCFSNIHVVSIGIEGLTSVFFNKKHVVSIGIECLATSCFNKKPVVCFCID